ncbi:MFS transporter, DHA2 family, metal-tetracycline-proton antiporter [Seinonella peptonophila]|uniref:MFS transporter, DHA2 family, metal-tetracycline-proton antiporter n=1 Tax=Seinonella peptonophila TaxID=112248 RepID=A0A1M5B0C0_9BACL|nr:MFS transporter [Seinonella peptonophila]SHF36011.1 MFS transporter, DHA2 family, metal-tetracycline-proton antiporter [Seinonella peptonophila]
MKMQTKEQTGEILMRIVMFTVTLSSMSVLMFIYILPEISKEFDVTNAQVSWLSSAYGLIYAIGTVTYGKLADRYKLKNLLTFGLIVFAMGSLVGLLSQTFYMALIGRCLQALGAGAIPATAVLIPVRYFTPERRGKALGMMATGLALGSALGPVISALIVSVAHWRWLFAVPLLIFIMLPFYRKYLVDDQQIVAEKFDWMGGSLLAATVALFLIGVTNGTWWYMISGLLTLGLFIIRIRLVDAPFVRPEIFTNKRYTFGLIVALLINGIGTSLYLLSPLLLSDVQQLPTSWIGYAMVPAAAASAIFGRKGGKLADLKGNSYLFFIASSLLFTCFILLSTFTGSSPLFIAAFLILGNVGQSFMLIVMNNSISHTLPKNQAGVGMGILQMLNFCVQAVSTGIYSRVLDLGSNIHWNWNPINIPSNGFIYSNIYFVLAGLHLMILLVYYFQFRRNKSTNIQLET